MTLIALITDTRTELANAAVFMRDAERPRDPIVADRETAAWARLEALEEVQALELERPERT